MIYFDINQDVKQLTELVGVKILIWIHLLSRQHKSIVLLIQNREEDGFNLRSVSGNELTSKGLTW